MSIVQIISIIIAIFFLIQVMAFTSKNKLRDQQAFFWISISIIGLLIALFLPILNKLSTIVGIQYMPSMVYVITFIFILSVLVYQTTLLSDQQEKIKNLVHEVAYLRKELKEKNTQTENDQ
ncbi:DUF2304 domain-containing protein [Aeribacillus alveayuensis]|uniref:DUF2304 domain-containing protein n=1 Tax=Aeribacillus alveayuensis TaxID=279215 RepID=A0ABT9VLX8_9BACI|nr:hypothetical protein [Bacillus alveayuensis]